MRIVLTKRNDITSRGLRPQLMDGYNYFYDSAKVGIRQQSTTDLLEVVKRKMC